MASLVPRVLGHHILSPGRAAACACWQVGSEVSKGDDPQGLDGDDVVSTATRSHGRRKPNQGVSFLRGNLDFAALSPRNSAL